QGVSCAIEFQALRRCRSTTGQSSSANLARAASRIASSIGGRAGELSMGTIRRKSGWPALGTPDVNGRSARRIADGQVGKSGGTPWLPPAGGADLQRVGGGDAAK